MRLSRGVVQSGNIVCSMLRMFRILGMARHFLIYFVAAFGYKRPIFEEARNVARLTGKPLLNAGCGSAYTEQSDVNLDVVHKEAANFAWGDIQNMWMLSDKQFGAAYASHVLEHVEDPCAALSELHRVADNVFVITPLPLWPTAWFGIGHKWVLWHTRKLCRVPNLLSAIVNKTVITVTTHMPRKSHISSKTVLVSD